MLTGTAAKSTGWPAGIISVRHILHVKPGCGVAGENGSNNSSETVTTQIDLSVGRIVV